MTPVEPPAARRLPTAREVVLFLGALRLARLAARVRTVPLGDLVARMVAARPRVRTDGPEAAMRAALRGCSRLARHAGGVDTCLTRSLVAGALLADRGDVVLRLGFRPSAEGGAPLDGHAWLEVAGRRLDPHPAGDTGPAYRPVTAIEIRGATEGRR